MPKNAAKKKMKTIKIKIEGKEEFEIKVEDDPPSKSFGLLVNRRIKGF